MEIAIVLILALIVFGPKRLPELGRGMGRGMREFKAGIGGKEGEQRPAGAIAAPKKSVDAMSESGAGGSPSVTTTASAGPSAALPEQDSIRAAALSGPSSG